MKKTTILFLTILLILTSVIAFVEFYRVALYVIKHLNEYLYFGIGAAIYILLAKCVFKNIRFYQTFSHELSHLVVGLCFGNKMTGFHINRDLSGSVHHIGKQNMFITLAPYCLPLFTYLFLIIGLIVPPRLEWFDIFIGLSLFFHLHCFLNHTRSSQPDIKRFGERLSYLFIATFLFFNLSVVLFSIRFGLWEALKAIFLDMADFLVLIS